MTDASFVIRTAAAADAAAVQAIYAPYVSETAISFEDVPPTIEEMATRITNANEQGYAFFVAVEGVAILGYAYAGAHRTRPAYRASVDVSAYVAAGAHRRGVGSRLYAHLLADLAGKGFHAAFAGITQPNAASVALHEAAGFSHVGTYREVGYKFGAWHDVAWWQRLL